MAIRIYAIRMFLFFCEIIQLCSLVSFDPNWSSKLYSYITIINMLPLCFKEFHSYFFSVLFTQNDTNLHTKAHEIWIFCYITRVRSITSRLSETKKKNTKSTKYFFIFILLLFILVLALFSFIYLCERQ